MNTRIFTLQLCAILLISSLSLASQKANKANLEEQLLAQGLVNIQKLSPGILVELKYSTTDNFLGADTYGDLVNCYLQPKVAIMLGQAHALLKKAHPELTLLVYDGARPRSIQRKMWALVVNTDTQDYVANPDRGSVHNFGSAVDLTIASNAGQALDMGTSFDYFGDLAQPKYEEKFLKAGKLTPQQIKNRKLLREVMTRAGFQAISIEWWHFNAVPMKIARTQYSIIE
ncbi:M15 family metallopeptidase [bacterium]|nr:M15 family metallopeptidase [bacterium]